MKDFLVPVRCAGLDSCCALRATTPEARGARRMWAAMRGDAWGRTTVIVARVAVVLVLLIVADRRRLTEYGAIAVRVAAETPAVHAEILASLITRTEVRT
ncbi:hypothetical protein ACWEPC_28290 [Nonomuraea sp. NPDC004297]